MLEEYAFAHGHTAAREKFKLWGINKFPMTEPRAVHHLARPGSGETRGGQPHLADGASRWAQWLCDASLDRRAPPFAAYDGEVVGGTRQRPEKSMGYSQNALNFRETTLRVSSDELLLLNPHCGGAYAELP